MLAPDEAPEAMTAPERVRALLAPWVDPEAVEVERAAVYRYDAASVARWRGGRVLLLGDAAHQMPPFAGQGLCSGVRDAHNAAWKLDLVLRRLAAPTLLDTYEKERAPHVRRITGLALAAGLVLQVRARPLAAFRDVVLRTLPGLGRRDFPMPPLRHGLLDPRRAGGTRFIQPWVLVEGEPAPRRLDEVLGAGFALLSWQFEPRSLVPAHRLPRLDALGVRFVRAVPSDAPASDGIVVRDLDGALGAWFAAHEAHAVWIRPDRTVYAAFSEDDGLTEALLAALGMP
jgi:3-(3-hydroxy-phenyl)propionate hydroxylase